MTKIRITLVGRGMIQPSCAEVLRLQLCSSRAFANVRIEEQSGDRLVLSSGDILPDPAGASARMFRNDVVRHAAQIAKISVSSLDIEALVLVS